MKPKYETFAELADAFKSGELSKHYYMMIDNDSWSLNYYDEEASDEHNEKMQEGCTDLFDAEYDIIRLMGDFGIPAQPC